jgi:hypothetical protein
VTCLKDRVLAVLSGALVKLLVGTVTAVASLPMLICLLVWEEQLYTRDLLALLEDTT